MIRISRIAAIAMMGIGLSLFAADIPSDTDAATAGTSMQTSLDAQIDKIKHADPAKRREMMNRFKEELAKMNREERMQAISRLREKMQPFTGGMPGHAPGQMPKGMTPMNNIIQTDQAARMQHFGTIEQMHQKQGVDQVLQMPGANSGGTGTSPLPFGSSAAGADTNPQNSASSQPSVPGNSPNFGAPQSTGDLPINR